ncbi:MAG: hypothetical protein H7289_14610 [Mucilaginibacter sp.]|nr:hypothetical protein [Mucilaginibacter sp.]
MKALKLTLIVPLLLFAISCKKTATTSSAVTTDEAADMAASSVAANSFGFASVADNIGVNAQTLNSVSAGGQQVNATGTSRQACGTTLADSITFSSTANSSVTFSAFYKYVRTLNCNASSQPDNLVNAITFKGNFDGPRLTSTDVGTSSVTIAGLTTNATNFVVNGTYNRKGTFTSKVGGKASGSSNVTITATNVLLSKPGREIVSGSATITISGTAAAGTFNYTGILAFKGGNQATLTVGTTIYLINLLTGTYVKQ